jgi:membrane protein
MQQHYGAVKGSQQAGAITFYGFLSVFPILALSFFVVGYVARVYPGAHETLRNAIEEVLPGLLGSELQLDDIQRAAAALGLVGLVGLLYSGLGWLSSMRNALVVVFELPSKEQPSFIFGKLRDLLTLALVGLTLSVSVIVSGLVSRFSTDLLDTLGLGDELAPLFTVLTVLLGVGASMVLFFTMFQLLAEPHAPKRSLWSGALVGAIGFEVLKQLSGVLLATTKSQPGVQAFGIALILLIWINYSSRVVLYAAAWAHTSRAARAERSTEPAEPIQGPPSPPLAARPTPAGAHACEIPGARSWMVPFAAGGGTALGLMALLRRRKDDA